MSNNKPTQTEIDEALNRCAEQFDEGGSAYPGMTYEQGVQYAIDWLQGDGPAPFED